MDVPRANDLAGRNRMTAFVTLPTFVTHAVLIVGWMAAIVWDLQHSGGALSIPWELGFVLYCTWTGAARLGLAAAAFAGIVRLTVLPVLLAEAANLWILELALIWCVNHLRTKYRDAQRRALRDPLTDLPNRRALDEFFNAELSRARRFERPLVVAVLDCDGFKRLNDQSGHAAGDEALQRIGQLLRRELRSYDGVFRLGGDEFVIVLPETDQNGAEHAFERLRTAFAYEVERIFPGLTASLGVAIFPVAPANVVACLARADESMYRAKRREPGETVFAVIEPLDLASSVPRTLIVD